MEEETMNLQHQIYQMRLQRDPNEKTKQSDHGPLVIKSHPLQEDSPSTDGRSERKRFMEAFGETEAESVQRIKDLET